MTEWQLVPGGGRGSGPPSARVLTYALADLALRSTITKPKVKTRPKAAGSTPPFPALQSPPGRDKVQGNVFADFHPADPVPATDACAIVRFQGRRLAPK